MESSEKNQMLRLIECLFSSDRKLNQFESYSSLKEMINPILPNSPVDEKELVQFIDNYLKYSVNTAHDFYSNQLWSQVESSSVLGELLAAVTNTSMYTYEVAPVATLLEKTMISHLGQMVWQQEADGIMTSGGTASNLQALLTARNFKLDTKKIGLQKLAVEPVILAADNCHYSIKRAANILGLGHSGLIEVPTDSLGQMSASALRDSLVLVKQRGQTAFCVVSTAGTTVEGTYDNLEELGRVCEEEDLWFHVDGAYGASALMSSTHRSLMAGVGRADSLSWDFHKMLGVNLPCAFLLMKNKGYLKTAISSQNDSYLFHDDDSIDLGPSSIQCGRRNDIVKLWITWLVHGGESFSDRIDKLFCLAQTFAQQILESSDFELLIQPQSINVCFRFVDSSGRRKEKQIREKLNEFGQLMINYSSDEKGSFFRMAITNPHLNEEKIASMIQKISEVGHEIH